MGGIGGMKGQGQASQAANQDSQAATQMAQMYSSLMNQISQSYYGQGGGNQLLQGLTQPGGGVSQLMNWQGLRPQELNELQMQMGQAGQSNLKSFESQIGGVANPQAVAQSMGQSNATANLGLATNLGSMAQQQELQGLESGVSGMLGATGQMGSLLNSGMSGLGGLMNTYMGAASGAAANSQAYGNPLGSMFGQLGANPGLQGGMKGQPNQNAAAGEAAWNQYGGA
jgi:hypothetical protein